MAKLRAALYARYSSDLQKPQSIDDQFRVCRQFAEQRGWEVVRLYSDEAMSAASIIGRAGINRLLHDAGEGRYEIVCTEALDRISRDQADMAHVYKLLKFHEVAIHTPSAGEVDELQIGFRGTMNALFLRDLGDKTRRGQRGRIAVGRSGGGLAYGYDIAPFDGDGAGGRRINDHEAAIVRRIFRSFAEGDAPPHIAERLNREGVSGPKGRPWAASAIRGHAQRGTGILNNELYHGVLIWNRSRFVKDPRTGRRRSRLNPEGEWVCKDVPGLRIIDEPLWELVKKRQSEVKHRSTAVREGVQRTRLARSRGLIVPSSILHRLLTCGRCGEDFCNVGRERYGCSARYRRGACDARETIPRLIMEEEVRAALTRLTEMMRLHSEPAARSDDAQIDMHQQEIETGRRQLDDIETRARCLMMAIEDGLYTSLIKRRLQQLEQQADRLRAKLQPFQEATRSASEEARVFHNAMEAVISRIHDGDETATVALRNAAASIRVMPGNKPGSWKFTLTSKLHQ